ncbi:hypothetical protein VTK73DRAFT_9065 [Phialemonium thermophilum]|uniref:Uncharacterized protein n=1 Tax=Phialemonium thermophilum TaxID=223376 RepID=A0ABR3W4R4_9PEZI
MLKSLDFGRGVFIRLKTNAPRGSLVIHDNFSNRTALRRRWFIQISALSTFDGWVLASRGDNGKAAGAQITQSRHGEVVTINTDTGLFWVLASLVPAAAVIPAPIAYIKVVAVKKLVVEPWAWLAGPPHRVHWSGRAFPSGEPHALHWACRGTRTFTVNKSDRLKKAYARIH